MKRLKIMGIVVVSLTMAACSSSNDEVVEQEEVTSEVKTDKKEIPAEEGTVSCTGTVGVPPSAHISLHARSKGIITKIHKIEGEPVKKGEILAWIEDPQIIQLQESYLKAKADAKYWKSEFARKSELFRKGVIPEREFESVESSYSNANAMLDSYSKQVSLMGISKESIEKNGIQSSIAVRSSVNGVIAHISVNNGMFVNADSPLFTIVNTDVKHLALNIFSTDIGKIREGQLIEFSIPGIEKTYEANVHYIGQMVELETKAVMVHADMKENYPEIVIGSTVFATVKLD